MGLTTREIGKTINIDYRTVIKIINYLKINGIKNRCRIEYSDSDLIKIQKFLQENPNTKVFFQKQTFLKKYGVDNPSKVKEIKEKSKQTIKEKYGVENISQSKLIKDKKKETCLKNYGVENPSQSKEVYNKMLKTKEEKYGDSNYGLFGSESYHKNLEEKYGNKNYNNGIKISETKKCRTDDDILKETLKSKQTRKEKYGNANYNNLYKIKKTNLEKYGVENIFENQQIKETIKLNNQENKENAILNGLYPLSEVAKIIDRDYSTLLFEIIPKLNIKLVENKINNYKHAITENSLNTIKEYCKTTENNGTSYLEKEVVEFIKSIYKEEVLCNNRSIISPLELDIYIPSENLAIEFNGLYWHSDLYKDKDYHKNKLEKCREKGIDLINIFEDDWIYKKEVCKSIISSRLNIYKNNYSDDYKIGEIMQLKVEEFLSVNSLKKYIESDRNFGLFYKNNLVAITSIKIYRDKIKITNYCVELFSKINNCLNIFISYITTLYQLPILIEVDNSIDDINEYLNVGFIVQKDIKPKRRYIKDGKRIEEKINAPTIWDCGASILTKSLN